ncbi:ERAP1-like C-terminal domain,Peptidase M1, membrane alanine aminopeptidase, N-terminal [Cinara cedri]|uniref:ERAP1-like C-terminal domain,Peptidase M1, membrane alanine aminopeptidase, N-terminal n=1 Tax=Cinara cedri TaxID=506608 RepID=A0A5E4M4G2_9HEMI|nr:ERAP1-like C-terminal domain,Peptidase M1, membrane alanine aminopeptidase, N-terminal [Cinara cedri]
MATVQARHRGHNIPDGGMTTFNEIEYDREGGVFLNRIRLILLSVIVFLLIVFSVFVGRYTAQLQFRQVLDLEAKDIQISFLAIEPDGYKVEFEPKLFNDEGKIIWADVIYHGRVEAIFRPKIDTAVISLHFGLLKIVGNPILKRRLSMETSTEQVLRDVFEYKIDTEVNPVKETLTVTTRENMRSGHFYSLFINFTGNISKIPEKGGFFKVIFYDRKLNKIFWYVATKLAPQGARHLLPCVDGQTHKAFFEVSVVRKNGTSVIFNTKLQTTEQYNGDLLIDRFEKTGLVRPDSLGLFMSNFKSQSLKKKNFVELVVWTFTPIESFSLLNEVLPNTLVFMGTYLETDFPTKKLDIVIVPRDEIGSAESPGLIVINDKVLENKSGMSIAQYQDTVETLIEHIIRQWLMPMQVVDQSSTEEKWLFDAIANFLRIVNSDNILPGWNLEARFQLDNIQPVMFYDSFTNSKSLSDIGYRSNKFKYISSHKGTSILRMLNYTFTEDIFKQTLREYIHTEIYKYNDAASFWKLLDDNVRLKSTKIPKNLDVFQIVNSWTRNKNYPLITVEVQGDDIILKQFRFNYNQTIPTDEWIIPVTLTSGMAYSTTIWMENSKEVRVPGYNLASNGSWILANQHQTGYYRVIYRDNLLGRILHEFKTGNSFDPYTVGHVVGDIFEGALTGIIKFIDGLEFLKNFIENAGPYYGHWNPIINAFNKIEMVLKGTKEHDSYLTYTSVVAKTAYNVFNKAEVNNSDLIFGMIEMLCFVGRAELDEYVLKVKEKYKSWKNGTNTNPFWPNYRRAAYCTILQYASVEDHRFFIRKYIHSKWTPDRKTLAKSFSCSRNTQFLTWILTFDGLHSEDMSDVWISMADNPISGPFVFYFFQNNWEKLYEDYADVNINLLSTMLLAAIRGLNTDIDLEMLQMFTEKHFSDIAENKKHPALLEVLYLEKEILKQKIWWRKTYESVIGNWLWNEILNDSKSIDKKQSIDVKKSETDRNDSVTNTSTINVSQTKSINEKFVTSTKLNATTPVTQAEIPTSISFEKTNSEKKIQASSSIVTSPITTINENVLTTTFEKDGGYEIGPVAVVENTNPARSTEPTEVVNSNNNVNKTDFIALPKLKLNQKIILI